jgi:hypothetical protein
MLPHPAASRSTARHRAAARRSADAASQVATCGVLRRRPVRRALVLGVTLAAGCSADRGDAPGAFPGASAPPAGLVPGTVAPGYEPYVEGLTENFVDGGRLVARLDEGAAACVAERWVALLDPAALQAAGIESSRMRDATLDDLADAVTVDEEHATALTASFAACEADHTAAFLDSLLLTSQITPGQRVCLGGALPPGLISAITVGVLTQDQLDADLAAQYEAALDACPAE